MLKTIMTLLSLSLLLSLLNYPNPSQAQSYTMICRGGGAMKATITEHGDEIRSRLTTTLITFRKSAHAASVSAPGAGECAWLDRPISATEPSQMLYANSSDPVDEVNIGGGKIWITRMSTDIALVLNAIIRGEPFYVRVQQLTSVERGVPGTPNYIKLDRVFSISKVGP